MAIASAALATGLAAGQAQASHGEWRRGTYGAVRYYAIPEGHALAKAEFNTIRLRLLKIAARVVEHGRRIRVHLPSSAPEKTLFRSLALGLSPSG